MDGSSFDRLARIVATATRRQLIRALAGGLAGGLLGTSETGGVGAAGQSRERRAPLNAACTPLGGGCDPGAQGNECCVGACDPNQQVCCDPTSGLCCGPTGGDCSTDANCCAGACVSNVCCTPNGGACGSAAECCDGACDANTQSCGCRPTTCAEQNVSVGTIPDGCGGTLNCGDEPSPTPAAAEPSPTPAAAEPSPTPTGTEPSLTPAVAEPSLTPAVGDCTLEQTPSGLILRFATRSPDGEFSLETRSAVGLAPSTDLPQTSQTTVTQANAMLLQIDQELSDADTWMLTVRYGAAFDGIRKAVFTTRDDQPIQGTIDGRPIVPLARGSDLGAVRFADGQPLPTVHLDERVAQGLADIFVQAQSAAGACTSRAAVVGLGSALATPAAPHSALIGACPPGHLTYPPLGATECVICRGGCAFASAACGYAAAKFCAAGSAICGPWYGACLGACLLGSVVVCSVALLKCLKGCREPGHGCCPIGCGDAHCCLGDEVCLDPAVSLCCGATLKPCGGKCCCQPDDNCLPGGVCCPTTQKVCGDACCPAGEDCLAGKCCPKICDKVSPAVCCEAFAACTECGCCPAGATCVQEPRPMCCPAERLCGAVCCVPGQVCKDAPTSTCFSSVSCPRGEDACPGGLCCPSFMDLAGAKRSTCCGTACCPSGQPVCCAPGYGAYPPVCNPLGLSCVK